jgi:cell division septal protein FtsQ
MKPKQNAGNKRVSNSRHRKQHHLLDVKLRESKERERKFRTVSGFVLKTLLFVSLVGGAWIGGKEALRRFLWENPDYFVHLEDLRFQSDGTLTREQVIAASGIVEGENIFKVDLAATRAILEKLPQVESAEVQRQLPNHMTISIAERRPVAWLTAKVEDDPTTMENSFLIDVSGTVMRTRTILPEYYHMPIISGVATGNLAPGQRVKTFEMQSALELVRLNSDSTRFQVRNIDLAKGYCLVVTDQKRAHITFGLDHLETQLARLNRLLDAIEPTGKEIQTVNLLVERNVPVTFYNPEGDGSAVAPPSAPPKPDSKDGKPKPTPVPVAVAVAVPAKDKTPAAAVAQKPSVTPMPALKKSRAAGKPASASPTPSSVTKPFRLNP